MAGVKTHHPEYDEYVPKWKRARDCVDGQDAVHSAGEAYLPKLKEQSVEDYRSYVMRAGFYNASWRTIAGLVGMAFRKEPIVDVPASVEPFLDDVTMSNVDIIAFAQNVTTEVLTVGCAGIMVDHPPMPNVGAGITKSGAETLGLRPTIQLYEAESIINWKYARINNRWALTLVVLEECEQRPDGEFATKEVTVYRVLDIDEQGRYRQRLFEVIDEKDVQIGGDMYPFMNGKPLSFIPFYIVSCEGVGAELDEPPLIDLIDVNLSHYRTNADYEHGCHFTGLPTAVVSGYQATEGERLSIGSQTAWIFPDPAARASFLEFSGQGLSSLRENLDRKEQQMAILGARMLAAEKKQAETATTAAIHRTGENSILSNIVIVISQAIERALAVFSEWGGGNGPVKFEINRDYMPTMMSAQDLTALMGLVQAGQLSEASLFDLLQRGDIIAANLSFADEQARIANQSPAMVVPA